MGELLNIAVYNPAILDDQDFLACFVARQDVVERLLQRLVEIRPGGLAQHHLILGQRGMGKTSLLRRLALAIRDDPTLGTVLLPLCFREEQYNVHNLRVFWGNCLDALADWFEKAGQPDRADALDREIAQLAQREPDPHGDAALACFKRWAKAEGKRPLLLLDNIDLVLSGLGRDENSQWSLRRVLQEAAGIVVVGASATYLEATADRKAAFYDFFQVTVLEPLTQDDLLACLRRLAQARGDEGRKVCAIVDGDPGRIRALHDLTGGNPRTLILLYLLLELDADGDVISDLERLLDQVTVLYKARVEDLPPQGRVILDAVALAWNPVVATEVATATGLETTTVSAQLDRLQRDGIVDKLSPAASRRTAYQLSERFFNIWYLMRHGPRRQRTRLRWLTGFLRSFYSPKQLGLKARDLLRDNQAYGLDRSHYCLALSDAVEDMGWRNALGEEARTLLERHAAAVGKRLQDIVDTEELPAPRSARDWAVHGNLLAQHLERYVEAEAAYRKAIELDPTYGRAWNALGYLLQDRLGRFKEAEDASRKAIELEPASARAWNALGYLLRDRPGRFEEAEAAFRKAIELDPAYARAWNGLGYLLQDRLGRFKEAEDASRKAIELEPASAWAWNALGYLLRDRPGRFKEAEDASRKAIQLEPASAWAWNALGDLLRDRPGRFEEAEAAFRKATELDPASAPPWTNLGYLLYYRPGRFEEAEAAYRKAIEIDPAYARAWNGLSYLLQYRFRRFEEAEAASRKTIELEPASAWAWNARGYLLEDRPGRFEEAEAAYREAIELDPTYARPWTGLGALLQDRPGRFEEAEAAFRKAIELDPAYARAWEGLIYLLQYRFGRFKEAEATSRKAIEHDQASARPWSILGYLLRDRPGRFEEAEAAFRKAIELDPASSLPWTGLGDLLQDRPGRFEEAEAAYRKAVELEPASAVPWTSLGNLLHDSLGRFEEAEAAYRKAIDLDPNDIRARCGLGFVCLYFLGRYDDAEAAYRAADQLAPADLVARSNLLALDIIRSRSASEVDAEFEALVPHHPQHGAALLQALRALSRDNFGVAAEAFETALAGDQRDVLNVFSGFVILLLREAASAGYGDKLLARMDDTGVSDRYWPLRAAFHAYLHGEEKLAEVNPEVRGAAKRIYAWLDGARSHRATELRKPKPARPRRLRA